MPVAGEDDVDADDDDDGDDEDDVGASGSSSVEKLRTPADLLGPLQCQQVERVPIWAPMAMTPIYFPLATAPWLPTLGLSGSATSSSSIGPRQMLGGRSQPSSRC